MVKIYRIISACVKFLTYISKRSVFFISKCKIKYFTKETFKILSISIFGLIIVAILVGIKFELRYNVNFLGQDLGYVRNKLETEELVNDYLNNVENIAYIDLEELPVYELKFVKKSEATDEKEKVLEAVKEAATIYYKVYEITLTGEVIAYVGTMEESEKVVGQLKADDENLEISVLEVITEESKNIETAETIVSRVIAEISAKKEAELEIAKARTTRNNTSRSSAAKNTTAEAPDIDIDIKDISFIKPAVGNITSRFGKRGSKTHTGVDIANSTGTTIVASASGTVTFTGWQGGYGNLVIISHGNGVQTYYAHCNVINVTAGMVVSQGEKIAEIGSTGNSTGSHVHLEIRINGNPVNPEKYI